MAFKRLKRNVESFLINPRGKRLRSIRKRRSSVTRRRKRNKRKNPQILLTLGNPRKGGSIVRKRHRRISRRRRHNPVVVIARRSGRRHSYRQHNEPGRLRRHNRRRRNPVIAGIDVGQIMMGAIAAMTTVATPTWFKAESPMMKYGIQAGTAIGGKFILEKLLKTGHSNTWMVVSLSVMAADFLREYVLKKVTLLTALGPVQIPTGTKVEAPAPAVAAAPAPALAPAIAASGTSGLGAYMNEMSPDYPLGTLYY